MGGGKAGDVRQGADHRDHRAAQGPQGTAEAPQGRAGAGPQPRRKAQGRARPRQSQRGGLNTTTSKWLTQDGHSRSPKSPATSLPAADSISGVRAS